MLEYLANNVPGWVWLIAAALTLIPINTKKMAANPLFESTKGWTIIWTAAFYLFLAFAAHAFGWHEVSKFLALVVMIFIPLALASRVLFALLGLRKEVA